MLLQYDNELVKVFMNSVFNGLNEVTSELFMIIKEEIKQGQHFTVMERRINVYFDLIVDLCRVLEMVSRWAPEVFLSLNLIHANRMIEFMFFVLKELFRQDFQIKMLTYCQMTPTRHRNIPQMLAPFIGIITNLYATMQKKLSNLDNLSQFVMRSDSFDIALLRKM